MFQNVLRRYFSVIAVLTITLTHLFCRAESSVKLGSLTFAANEVLIVQKVASILVKQIYEKIKLTVRVQELPPTRANKMDLEKEIDGEIARIYAYGEKNPSLIRVEPSYYYMVSAAFCLDPKKINIKSKKDLGPFSVASIQGVAHAEEATSEHKDKISTNDGIQLYDLVVNGRVQIAIDSQINGKKIIMDPKYSAIKLCGTIARHELYIYLNASSEKYRKPVSKIIKKLKESGELDLMIKAAEDEVLNNK